MDIDLRLPSGEHEKPKEENHYNQSVNLLDREDKLQNVDVACSTSVNVEENLHIEDDGGLNSPVTDMADFKDNSNLEPLSGMEFGSHGEAYSFYQEYARSMGFNTAIQNSRRSKTSREFIDAKFACSRYGIKREHEKSYDKPRSRQGNKQDPENASGRRSCGKTDCKASIHVKRRSDGKWIIHRFEKEHNHELLPAQAVSEQTRRMYAAMARQFAEYKNVVGLKDSKSLSDKGRNLGLEEGEASILLDFFVHMQSMNSNFFYAIEVNEDQRLRNLLWVDAKSRHDYVNFNDVVSFDTTYIRNKYKMPLALFIGVNQHCQFMLLGCALLSDESVTTLSWVMQTWLKAVGGESPKAIITEQDSIMKSVVPMVFPSVYHCVFLWHILGKVSETLNHVIKQNDSFMEKFSKCIYRSWTDEKFDKRWHKLVDRFGLKENEWFHSLYEDRKQWVPAYMRDVFLGGMSAAQRSESVNSFFDKYVHKKTMVLEFMKQCEPILQDRYEEEAKAESDMWTRQPVLKSPSPFEKHVSGMYTHAVLKKFQIEVLGAVACIPRREREDRTYTIFRVEDFEKNQEFAVVWNELKSEVSCICHLFEFKGFLCRHALIVLQICGLSTIPSQYILKRWMKDAKNRFITGEGSEEVHSRLQRYNDLCQRAMKLGEEGSLSQETYSFALRAIEDTFATCISLHNSNMNLVEAGTSAAPGLLCIEEDGQNRITSKTNKKKTPTKKRKASTDPDAITDGGEDNLQQLDNLNTRSVPLDGYFGPQQGMLNLMGPSRDNYYSHQQTIQGLGQLNTLAPNHDGYYGSHTNLQGLGQMEFFRAPGFAYSIREEPNTRSAMMMHHDMHDHLPTGSRQVPD